MKPPDLIQSKWLRKVELTLEPDGVVIFDKSLWGSKKVHVYYENIPPKAEEITVSSKKLFGWAIFTSVLTMICIPVAFFGTKHGDAFAPVFWGVFALFFWLMAFNSRKSLIVYSQNGARFVLFRSLPSSEAVDVFIKKLFASRNIYLQKKYGRFLDEESLESKINRLNFLRAQEVITEENFEAKREEFLKGKKPSGPMGFAPQ